MASTTLDLPHPFGPTIAEIHYGSLGERLKAD